MPIRPIEAVPESISVSKLLSLLQKKHTKIAVVVDEHGGTSGIVTISDVMEQIVGATPDEYAHAGVDRVVEIGAGDFLIDGSMAIDDVVELIGFEPAEASECETAGGLLLALFDRIPDEGDEVSSESGTGDSATFMVVDMDNLRIDKIRVVLRKEEQQEDA